MNKPSENPVILFQLVDFANGMRSDAKRIRFFDLASMLSEFVPVEERKNVGVLVLLELEPEAKSISMENFSSSPIVTAESFLGLIARHMFPKTIEA